MAELILHTGEFIDESESVHDVILNRLDLRHPNNGKSYLYDPEEFRKALPEFLETPWIYAGVHPKNIGKLPMEDALKEVEGKIVGAFQDVSVNNTGTLFMGKVSITDPYVDGLIKNGKALLSTAFSATPDKEGVLRNIVPNHVLVYPLDSQIPPGDHAALFLNQQSEKNDQNVKNMPDEKNEQLDLMREIIQNQAAKDELQVKLTESTETIHNQQTQLEEKDRLLTEKDGVISQNQELIKNQSTEIETLKGKVSELSQVIADQQTATKNSKRDRIFNQFLPGTRKAFDARKAEIYDDSKFDDLVSEMFEHQAAAMEKQPPVDESGDVDVQNQGEDVKQAKDANDAQQAWEACEVRL